MIASVRIRKHNAFGGTTGGSEAQVPATISAIADAIQWAERIMQEIDRHWPNEVGG